MSEMTICDFFIVLPLGNKKAPPASGRAIKNGDEIACLTCRVLYQKLAKKSIKKIDFELNSLLLYAIDRKIVYHRYNTKHAPVA